MSTETDNKKYVELMNERSFGDMIGIPFAFFFQEFKGIILAILKYASPIFAVSILLMVLFFKEALVNVQTSMFSSPSFFTTYFFTVFLSLIGALTIVAVTDNYISLYKNYGKGNFTIKDVGKGLFIIVLKYLGGLILSIIMVVILAFLNVIPVIGGLLFWGLFFFLSVNMSLFPIIVAYKKEGVGKAFSGSFKLIKGKWWFSFGLYIVFTIIMILSVYALLIPMYLIGIASFFAGSAAGAATVGVIIMMIFFFIIYMLVYFSFAAIMNILFSFQYFNLLVRKEGAHLTDRISAINDNIKQEGDIFEVKEETFSDDITEQKEESQNEKKEELMPDNKEEEPKTEDEWSKLLDDNEKNNRFEDGDDENDRFKPKF